MHRKAIPSALPDGAATFDQQRTGSSKAVRAEPVEAAPRAPLATLLALPGTLDPPCLLKPGEDRIDAPRLAPRILGDLQPIQFLIRAHECLQAWITAYGHQIVNLAANDAGWYHDEDI